VSRSKYGAVATTIYGIRFHSQKEARRYGELKLLEKAGEIRELELQPVFPISVPQRGRHGVTVDVAKYIADFRYRSGPKGLLVIEDVKGMRTALYRLKKRLVECQYGITITEV
jgi:hypothetical protein